MAAAGLHDDIPRRLKTLRKSFGHIGTKRDASEKVWLELLQTYLPQRYKIATADVVDSQSVFGQQFWVADFTATVYQFPTRGANTQRNP